MLFDKTFYIVGLDEIKFLVRTEFSTVSRTAPEQENANKLSHSLSQQNRIEKFFDIRKSQIIILYRSLLLQDERNDNCHS